VADEQPPVLIHLLFHMGELRLRCLPTLHSSGAAMETTIHTVVNNECTKKKGANFLAPSMDSESEALLHHHWALLIPHSHY